MGLPALFVDGNVLNAAELNDWMNERDGILFPISPSTRNPETLVHNLGSASFEWNQFFVATINATLQVNLPAAANIDVDGTSLETLLEDNVIDSVATDQIGSLDTVGSGVLLNTTFTKVEQDKICRFYVEMEPATSADIDVTVGTETRRFGGNNAGFVSSNDWWDLTQFANGSVVLKVEVIGVGNAAVNARFYRNAF
ncbi:hypothetical protein LCGC14_0452030 [marine sediment metagenome]|uniref:Uncharacterized protein n=1 Tax=marine sediment metagenome TaxID=412755 RepID=A0A0F9T0R8_9ZZZZ